MRVGIIRWHGEEITFMQTYDKFNIHAMIYEITNWFSSLR